MTQKQTAKIDIEIDYILYASTLEKEWKKTLTRLTDRILLTAYPEIKDIVPDKIKELKQNQQKITDIISSKLILIKEKAKNEFTRWFWREWVKITDGQELFIINKHISRLKRLLSIKNQNTKVELLMNRYN